MPPKWLAARLETTGPRAPIADPKQITKATTSHGAGIQENTSRLTIPRNVLANVVVTVGRNPERSAAQPAVMMPKIERRPAAPNAEAAAMAERPDCTRYGTSCVVTENVVIDVNAKSWTICQYSRVRRAVRRGPRLPIGAGAWASARCGLLSAIRRHGNSRSSGSNASAKAPMY